MLEAALNFFNLDLKKILIFIFVIGLPLASINMQRAPDEAPWYLQPLNYTVGFFQNGFSSFASGVRGTTSLYLNLVGTKKQNLGLIQENAQLRAQLSAMTELKLENERLGKLLDFRQSSQMKLLAARVIGQDVLPDRATIRINRGENDGLKGGLAVITVEGVVGYIYRPDANSSQVLLMTDNYSVIDGIVQRSRARGLVEGKSKDSCRLRYLQRTDDVVIGDLIVTGGLSNIFPKGFPIGYVTAVKKSPRGISQDVEIKPVVNPNHLEEVFVVMDAAHVDYLKEDPKSSKM